MADRVPDRLSKDTLDLKKTRGDGWCIYTALLYELHQQLVPPGKDIAENYNRWLNYAFLRKMVDAVLAKMSANEDMPKKTAGPAPAEKYKAHIETIVQGIGYTDPANPGTPYTAEAYLNNLLKFRGDDINTGPVEWGDGKVIGDLFAALLGVGVAIYKDDGSTINPNTYAKVAVSDESLWDAAAADAGYRYILFSESINATKHKAGHYDALIIDRPTATATSDVKESYRRGKDLYMDAVLEFLGKPMSGGGTIKANLEAIVKDTIAAATAAGIIKSKANTAKKAIKGKINSLKGSASKRVAGIRGALSKRRSRPNVELNVLGELVYDDTRKDEDNRTFSGIPFSEAYFYAANDKDSSPSEAADAWGVFAKFFMNGSMFDPDDPKMPCSLEERYFLMKGLQKRRDKLLVESDAMLRSGVHDAMQIRMMMERIVKIGVMLDELHEAEGDYCLELDDSGQLVSTKSVGASEEGVQSLLRQVIFLFLQAEKPVAEFKGNEAMDPAKFIEMLQSKPEIGEREKFSEFIDKYTGDVPPALFDTLELLASGEGVYKAYDRAVEGRFGQLYDDLKEQIKTGIIKSGTSRETRFKTKISELEDAAKNVALIDKIKGLLGFVMDELNAMTQKRKELEEELRKCRETNATLGRSLMETRDRLAAVQAEAARLAADLATRTSERDAALRGTEDLRREKDAEKGAIQAQLDTATARITQLGDEINDKNAKIQAAEAATVAKQGELDKCREENGNLKTALATAQATIEQLGREKKAVEEQLATAVKRAEDAERALAAARAAAEAAAGQAAADIAAEQTRVRDATAEAARLNGELEALRASSAAAGEQGQAAIAAAAAAAATAERAQKEATAAAAEKERKAGEAVAAANKKASDAEEAAREARAAAEAAKNDAAGKIAAAERAKGEAEGRAAAAAAAAAAAEEKAAAATAAAAAAASKQKEAEQRAKECSAALATAQAAAAAAEAERERLAAENESLKGEIAALNAEKDRLEGELRNTIEALRVSKEENTALQERIAVLERELAELKGKLENCEGLQAALAAKESELNAQTAAFNAQKGELEEAQAQANAAREEAAAASQAKAAAEAAAASSRDEAAAATAAAATGQAASTGSIAAAERARQDAEARAAAAEGRIAAAEDAAARAAAAATAGSGDVGKMQDYLNKLGAALMRGNDFPEPPAGITGEASSALSQIKSRVEIKAAFTRPTCFLSYFVSFFLQLFFFMVDTIVTKRIDTYRYFDSMYKKIHARMGGKEEDHLKIIDTLHFLLAAGESYVLSKRQADGSPLEAPPGLVVLEEGVSEDVYQNGRVNTFNAIHDTLIIELNEYVKAKNAKQPSPHPELDTIDEVFTSVVDGKSYSIPNVYFPDAAPIPGLGPTPRLSLVFKPNSEFTQTERQKYIVTKVQASSASTPSYTETEKGVAAGAINKFLDEITINYNQLMGLFIVGLRAYMMTSIMKENLDKNRCKLPSFVELDPQSPSIDAFKGARPKAAAAAGTAPLSYSAAVSAATVTAKDRESFVATTTFATVNRNLQTIRDAIKKKADGGSVLSEFITKLKNNQFGEAVLRVSYIKERLKEAESVGVTRASAIDSFANQFRAFTPTAKQQLVDLLK